MRRPHDLLLLPALLAALPGCEGCHRSKPYTPYTLSDAPTASAGQDAGPPGGDAGALTGGGAAFTPVPGTPAPGDGKSWPMEGGAVEPPAGHAFAEGLVFDADGDDKPDLLAWSRAPDGLRGEVWFAPGKDLSAGRMVTALPGDLAAPGCKPEVALTRIGAGMVVLDFDPRCGERARDHAARWIAVFRMLPGAAPELGLEIRMATPAEGEALAVAVDGRDRDGDGRGDLTATITLSGAPRPLPGGGSASAVLAFFDRPAGLSRDPTEPEASLKTLASGLISESRRRTTAPHVVAAATAALRLHALLCEEGDHPPITTSAGPARCGDVHLVDDAIMAEAEAAVNLGDPFAALAAEGLFQGRRKDLDRLIGKHVRSIAGKLVRATAEAPDLRPPPSFGPVAFDGNGDILVRGKDRVVRVDHLSFQETPVDAAVPWPTRLSWPAGAAPSWTLASVEERCDAPTLIAHFEAGGDHTDVPIPILTPPRCAASPSVPVDLLGTSSQGALLSIRGDLIAVPKEAAPRPVIAETLGEAPGAPVALGAGRSPDGSAIALSTSRGILVAILEGRGRGATARIWTTPAVDGATACAPANGADRIACAVKGAVAIYDAK